MINTENLRKTSLGEFLVIGGDNKSLECVDFTLFNYGITNSNPIKMSDNFSYLLTTEAGYILGRAKSMANNWPFNYKKFGKKSNLIWMLAKIQAKKELNSIKVEHFLANENKNPITPYTLGNYNDIDFEKLESRKYSRKNIMSKQISYGNS